MKNTRFLLILVVGLFGFSACAVSEAQKQSVKKSTNPSAENAKTATSPTPPKKLQSNDNPVEMTAEDIENASVKADDYEENMKSGKSKKDWCNVDAFVMDNDPNGLNIRAEGDAKDEIIGKIPFNEEGTTVHIIQSNFGGWLKINRAETVDGTVVFDKEGWVSANLLGTSTAGYGTKGVKLYEAGKGTKVLVTIPPSTMVRVSSCDKSDVRVKYKKFEGWLDLESQCGNPVTNCS